MNPPNFDKYQKSGAYHWRQLNPNWSNTQFNAPLSARYQAILKRLPPSIDTVLDAGCGDGYLLFQIHRRNPMTILHGLDSDQTAIRLATQQLTEHSVNAILKAEDIYQLSYPDAMFDAVIFTDVIEHLEKPHRALSEISRVLKVGGILLLSTPQRQPGMILDKYHVQEFSSQELTEMLKPFFQSIKITACWPMRWLGYYQKSHRIRTTINAFTRLGYNPFGSSGQPSLKFAQLIAKCEK
jgi:2-polyprenyl-3-methyl-5-hydroxy-6-metoxy-1,4-benzoquinol methylase